MPRCSACAGLSLPFFSPPFQSPFPKTAFKAPAFHSSAYRILLLSQPLPFKSLHVFVSELWLFLSPFPLSFRSNKAACASMHLTLPHRHLCPSPLNPHSPTPGTFSLSPFYPVEPIFFFFFSLPSAPTFLPPYLARILFLRRNPLSFRPCSPF